MNKRLLTALSFIGVLIVGVIIVALQQNASTSSHQLKVVAAENVWGSLAEQIGGDDVTVTSVISDPTADPHLYESNAQTAAAIAQADIVIVNGLGYDDFMDKLLSASPNSHRTVVKIADVLHAKNGDNPHFWYDLSRLDQITAAIQAAYNATKPDATTRFAAHTARLSDSLIPVFDTAVAIKRTYAGTSVAYTERVPGYLLPALGLDNKTPATFANAIEEGNEPSPADQALVQTLITKKEIRTLLYNAQAESPATQHIRKLATDSGVPVVAVTETLPANQTYQSWMKGQLDAIRAALNNTK